MVKHYFVDFADCLDGSLPAYHLHRGFGAGANNWLLQFEASNSVWCFLLGSEREKDSVTLGK